jgi:hypothetical protein
VLRTIFADLRTIFACAADDFTVSHETNSPINREFYLAKGTEKFILDRYLLSGILLMLLSLRPWGVAARPAILENRGAKSHFCENSTHVSKNQ